MSFIVAIDGPAGTGKGTIAKIIANKLGFINIDTGAMYRCVTLEALRNNINIDEIGKIENLLEKIDIEFKRKDGNLKVFLNGEDVSEEIRKQEVNNFVAKFAALKCVRDKMTLLQQKMGELGNIVMEGRDIGTTVFPNADVKIYLDASVEERARRRYNQNIEKGMDITYEEVLESIKARHILETQREISPLRKAEDAVLIDSTNLTIEEVTQKFLDLIEQKRNK